ncbi:hypothetical protein [Aquariibacter albus]|uniref:Uncharacterized protein n=1 Tax=Aquariibacter albus TaxID=2759899 RepID=A0A839HU10_9BURK|nr:hypothetical protein [Aquariibacter albus]MBB1162901.1 hypothetical protein [Aquariibacter albus]
MPVDHPRRRALQAAASGLLLAGCAGLPGSPGRPASGLSPALAAQQQRLADALAGTPVQVQARGPVLRVRVPLRHAHAPGQTAVKPPLQAVLEQLAIGFKPHAAVSEVLVRAPADAGLRGTAAASQAAERVERIREQLLRRGIESGRVRAAGAAEGEAVELLLRDRP